VEEGDVVLFDSAANYGCGSEHHRDRPSFIGNLGTIFDPHPHQQGLCNVAIQFYSTSWSQVEQHHEGNQKPPSLYQARNMALRNGLSKLRITAFPSTFRQVIVLSFIGPCSSLTWSCGDLES
jgi:hypothetical protein